MFLFFIIADMQKQELIAAEEDVVQKSFQKEGMRLYIEDCLIDSLEEGLILIGKQGRLWEGQEGGKIAFQSVRNGNWEIYVMDPDGSNVIQLTDEKTSLSWEPVWSPDGNKLAFTSDRDGDWDIYVMDSDGSNVIQLTQHAKTDVSPVWSPEGDKIAFASSRSNLGFFEIFIVDVEDKEIIEGPIMRGLPTSWIKK